MQQLARGLAKDDFGVKGRASASSPRSTASARSSRPSSSSWAQSGYDGRAYPHRSRLSATGIIVTISTRHLAFGLVGFLIAGTAPSLSALLEHRAPAQVDEEYRGRAISIFYDGMAHRHAFGALIGGWFGDHVACAARSARYACV